MMNQETLKRMKREKLLGLIQEALNNINSISASIEIVKKQQEKISESHEQINGEEGFLKKVNDASSEMDEKLSSIRDAYAEVIGDEETHGMKDDIEELLSKLQEDNKKINTFKEKVFGLVKTEEDGTKTIVSKGISKELDEFLVEGRKTYEQLIADIQTRLSPGATSVELATTFREKVEEFKKSSKKWENAFVGILIGCIIYFAVTVFDPTSSKTLTEEWVQLLHRLPLIGLIVWLGAFMGNRRAENKKLEESYKHKEVMARSYTGYRRTIEDIDDNDKVLLNKHMDNLLSCINEDSSKFLKTEGEQHPFSFFSIIKNPLDKDKGGS